ncbi:transcription elongation factor GreA [Bombilactobacillus folatiphilus]|uniref:Transcription elongation factor GreA n=1 Tax=Bombilactobacillus folatiphilus TaxID=2923362 RepID=A0ABY4P9Y8_9LACO|nr:transcription elongation factor GreA [Bombilactobacillus folatiphilus]UQS82558.1 transcription elongation factor GreA [Bombilactobacillus folatiphilus]
MAEQRYPMTAQGKQKLEQELEDLKLKKRPEIIERIKIARGFGDLSENSEYSSAKDEQSIVESRISEIMTMLQYADVVDVSQVDENEVSVGKTVTFQEDGEEAETYQIVGAAEADPLEGKISNNSPIAKSLLGKKVDDLVEISTPGGSFTVKIIDVQN